MPVVSMMRLPGDPDALLARMTEHLEPVTWRLAPSHGGLLNIVARDGDAGVVVINVWESDEGRHWMAAEPEVQEALRKAELPPPAFESFDVATIGIGSLADHAEPFA